MGDRPKCKSKTIKLLEKNIGEIKTHRVGLPNPGPPYKKFANCHYILTRK